MEYRKKLSVDFLKQSTPESQISKQSAVFLNKAVMLFGAKILEAIASTSDGQERLHAIVEKQDIPIADALQVVEMLSTQGMLSIKERDKLGNYLLSITKQGREMVSRST